MATARIEGDLDTTAHPTRIARILRRAADGCSPEGAASAKVLRALADTVIEGHRFGPDGGRLTVTMSPGDDGALREDADLTDTLRGLLKRARDAGLTGPLVEVRFSLVISDDGEG
ncbi:MAG: hypothetical protein Q8S73_43105 [Deltaproteobacteria bacterium]|nr:hypothetical protein [Myxococcales bacterium]MDP3220952.1 hypothetical protein [Deltaproteobacteria bacterium]